MSFADALVATVAERARRTDISPWQKSQEMRDFQMYLRDRKQPHSTRDLARLIGMGQAKISEQLVIAAELDKEALAKYGTEPGELDGVPHSALLRIAKLPHYLRRKPLRDALRKDDDGVEGSINSYAPKGPREHRRAAVYARMREEGSFSVEVPKPVIQLTTKEAKDYLDEFLPALANLVEVVMGTKRTHYIGLTGNGGIVVYLAPVRDGPSLQSAPR